MSESSAVSFHQLSASWEDLQCLSEDTLAILAVLSSAVNEVQTLQLVFVGLARPYVNEKAIDSALNIRQFFVLRTISSKIFEIRRFLESLTGARSKTSDCKLQEWAGEQLNEFTKVNASAANEVARDLRNEAAFHYSFESARKNLRHVNSSGDFSFYTHKNGGNDFFPIGEEVLFQARLNRRWKNNDCKEHRDGMFREWLDWTLESVTLLISVHAHFCKDFIFPYILDNRFEKVDYEIPIDYMADPSGRLPLFISKKSGQ